MSSVPLRHAAAAATATLALPVLGAGLLLHPRWRRGLHERLGLATASAPGGAWVHAASVGELRAALRLVRRLEQRGLALRTSTTTLGGRQAMRHWRPDLACELAPLDHPWCAASALARARPRALVIVEAELWPCWIAAARRRGVPVLLVSARISDASFARYRRLEKLVAPTLARLSAVGARSQSDAERFLALGAAPARVSVTGDLKLDVEDAPQGLAPALERALGAAPLLVAGSTHAGEEATLLDALDALERAGHAPLLALAPRHPERVPEVLRLLRRRGRAGRRRSRLGQAPLAPGEVLVLDTLGELAPLYTRARIAFVGGTLVPRGGHNVAEPASVGCPVLVGPHTSNVRQALGLLEASGAARSVPNAGGLAGAFGAWLRDPGAAERAGAAGRRVLAAHRGSAERSAALVEAVLAA